MAYSVFTASASYYPNFHVVVYKLKMNKKLAKLKYLPNNFEIIEDGDHVICAISNSLPSPPIIVIDSEPCCFATSNAISKSVLFLFLS